MTAFDKNEPKGSYKVRLGIAALRNNWVALEDFLSSFANFPGNEGSDAGEINFLKFEAQTSLPSGSADKGKLCAYDVSGKAELHWIDEDSNQLQWTSGGTVNVSNGDFPSGTYAWFYANSAPSGWTLYATATDCLVATKGGSQAYNVAGGILAGTWTQPSYALTSDELPAHTHNEWETRTKKVDYDYGNNYYASATTMDSGTPSGWNGNAHNHGTSYRPYAAVGIICVKD